MRVYDILGIGFGPANIALAIALEEQEPGVSARFLEARTEPAWQPGMLLDGSDIQNNPSRDLVSLRNPRSHYSFLNYLFEEGRLIEHLNLPIEFPLRKEYARYITWVARQFDEVVDYGRRAEQVRLIQHDGEALYEVTTACGGVYLGRSLVVAPGRAPYLPEPFDSAASRRVFHLTDYLFRLEEFTTHGAPESVAVVGGSQSAAELTLDLARRFPRTRVRNLVRSYSLRLKDTSPFSEEGYFPAFTEYYHRATAEGRRRLDAYMHGTNYSSVDADVLKELYLLIYEQRLDGDQKVHVDGNRLVTAVREQGDKVVLEIEERNTALTESDTFDLVVVATGFRDLGPGPDQEPYPPVLEDIVGHFRTEESGELYVAADYALEPRDSGSDCPPVLLNGLCESSHGIGDAGSFSLLSLRAGTILDGLLKRGTFAAPAHAS
ncbi:lysine N(6)-hydroxylase/L-ornithine N(5)-oxygenase family protein [Streptomyces gobiensis]|uniref:lysine N(6)-hydroxylase/L-ornithine N(5)-oxygenase family protein n=1 Tax=Streptomyces gobiensis TaxID=2875706 RepID=UPI001E4A84CC|nr:SidA/IucD/PvdA family monooxygenase [Streptomyces gobiensis]UGY91986.1 SidA/IucD/PvdA family monooxygenase [Streptomyces gobiensis]